MGKLTDRKGWLSGPARPSTQSPGICDPQTGCPIRSSAPQPCFPGGSQKGVGMGKMVEQEMRPSQEGDVWTREALSVCAKRLAVATCVWWAGEGVLRSEWNVRRRLGARSFRAGYTCICTLWRPFTAGGGGQRPWRVTTTASRGEGAGLHRDKRDYRVVKGKEFAWARSQR